MDVITAYFHAVNREDWIQLADLWQPDAELRTPSRQLRCGAEKILEFYPDILSGYAKHHDAPIRRITDDHTIVVEIRFTGLTHRGQVVTFDAVDVFDLGADRIKRLSIWYDLAEVNKQLTAG